MRLEGRHRVLIEGGGEDHRRGLLQHVQMAGGLEAIHPGHAYIDEHDIRGKVVREVQRLVAVGRFAHDLDRAELDQEAAQALARRRFVIDDQHLQTHGSRRWRHAAGAVRSISGKRSVTMYSASKRPDFMSARSPYMRARRSRMLASARRLPSRIPGEGSSGLRTTIVTSPPLTSPVMVTVPPWARGSMPW